MNILALSLFHTNIMNDMNDTSISLIVCDAFFEAALNSRVVQLMLVKAMCKLWIGVVVVVL